MKKHLLPIILIVFLCCLLGVSLSACNVFFFEAPDEPVLTFKELDDGSYTLSRCAVYGDDVDLVIPSTYNGKPVTHINSNAFSFDDGSKKIKTIEIPASITAIPDFIFFECSGLDTAYYTGTLSDWCNISFGGAGSNPLYFAHHLYVNGEELTGELQIPDDVQTVKSYAFYGLENVTSITIPDNVTSIGAYAFAGNAYLQSASIGNGVTIISQYAFRNCANLTALTLGNRVETICDHAFESTGIESLDIPESVTEIGALAFSGSTKLINLTIRSKSLHVYDSAFNYCRVLQRVNYIGDLGDWLSFEFDSYSSNPMYYSKSLYVNGELLPDQLTVPDGALKMTRLSLISFETLTSIILPDSLKSIRPGAFTYCKNLKNIYYKGTEQQWSAIEIGLSNNPFPSISISYFSEENPYENGTASRYAYYWHYNEYQQPELWMKS